MILRAWHSLYSIGHTWRERLDRPQRSRLHRKAWAYSELLFPNSKGEALKKQAMHDALQRLGVPELGVRLTPELGPEGVFTA